jgi:predicted DNA-binding protein YlxM (UPF0122 family)
MGESSGKNKLYTVPEFAALAGVSKQAVYDRIKKDLGGYTEKRGGKTLISEKALCMVGNGAVAHGVVDQSSGKVLEQDKNERSKALEQSSKADCQADGQVPLLSSEESSKGEADSQGREGGFTEKSSETDKLVKRGGQDEYSLLDYLIKENARLISENERKDAVISEKDRELHSYYERVMGLTEQLASLAEREQDIASKALNTTGQAQLLHAMSGDQSDVLAIGKGNTLSEETPPEKPKKSPWWKRDKKQK